tara:strand:+ start:1343 stop:1480 length:138 start_codon:yes stop_codon:yes gene_type:complete
MKIINYYRREKLNERKEMLNLLFDGLALAVILGLIFISPILLANI